MTLALPSMRPLLSRRAGPWLARRPDLPHPRPAWRTAVSRCGLALAAVLSLAGAAQAHDLWLAPQDGAWVLRYGHADARGPLEAGRSPVLASVDAAGQPLPVTRSDDAAATRLQPQGAAAVLMAQLDTGYWSRPVPGSRAQNVPKTALPGPEVTGVHALKFGKAVLRWGEAATRAQGQRLELVPMQAQPPRAGGRLTLQVLFDGQPLPGASVRRGEDDPAPLRTDAQGRIDVAAAAGWQTLVASHRVALTGDPRADAQSLSSTFTFDAR